MYVVRCTCDRDDVEKPPHGLGADVTEPVLRHQQLGQVKRHLSGHRPLHLTTTVRVLHGGTHARSCHMTKTELEARVRPRGSSQFECSEIRHSSLHQYLCIEALASPPPVICIPVDPDRVSDHDIIAACWRLQHVTSLLKRKCCLTLELTHPPPPPLIPSATLPPPLPSPISSLPPSPARRQGVTTANYHVKAHANVQEMTIFGHKDTLVYIVDDNEHPVCKARPHSHQRTIPWVVDNKNDRTE